MAKQYCLNFVKNCMIAAAMYILILALILAVNKTDPTSSIIFGGSDNNYLYWAQWNIERNLKENFSIYNTCHIGYPTCVNLAYTSLSVFNSLVSIPLNLIFTRVITYNIIYLSTILIAAFGGFLLAHHFTKNSCASFIAGFIFGFSPHHFSMYTLNISSIHFVPFFILFLFKFKDKPSLKNGLFVAIFLFLQTLTEWYIGLFCIIFWIFFHWFYIFIKRSFTNTVFRKKFIKNSIIYLVIFAILILPFAYPLLTAKSSEYTYKKDIVATFWYGTDLVSLFAPSGNHYIWGKYFHSLYDNKEGTVLHAFASSSSHFLGYTSLLLFLLFIIKKVRMPRFWKYCFVCFLVLSMGSALHIMGIVKVPMPFDFTPIASRVIPDIPPQGLAMLKDGIGIPLPYLVINWIPIFSSLRVPERIFTFAMLAAAMIVAIGLVKLLRQIKPKYCKTIYLLVLILLIVEFLPTITTYKPQVNGFYYAMRDEQEEFAVFEIPQTFRAAFDYYFYQTVHSKKLAGGLAGIGRFPEKSKEFINKNNFAAFLYYDQTGFNASTVNKDIKEFRQYRIKYIIYHDNLDELYFKGFDNAAYKTKIKQALSNFKLMYDDDEIEVYRVY